MSFSGLMVQPRRRVIACIGQSLLADGRLPPVLQKRLSHAAGLYRRLSRKEGAACIYVSGADVAGDGALRPEGRAMAHELQSEHGVDESDIDIDVEAWSTIENAVNAIAPIRKRAAKEVILVTSDFHGPRAAFIFKTVFAAMNATDLVLTVDTHPSDLPIRPVRPEEKRPFEINEWTMLERLELERLETLRTLERLERLERMVSWLQLEGFTVMQEDCSEALAALTQLTASSAAALAASSHSPTAPVGDAPDGGVPTGPPPLVCDTCGRRFGSSTLLAMHCRRCVLQENGAS